MSEKSTVKDASKLLEPGFEFKPVKNLVAIGMPTHEYVYTEFMLDMVNMQTEMVRSGLAILNINPIMARMEVARNYCASFAVQQGAEYLLFVDSDMRFPKDTFHRLLARQKDVIACNAVKRVAPYSEVKTKDIFGKRFSYKKGGCVKVDYIGTAVMLIKTEVFLKIEPPWFYAFYTRGQMAWRGEDYTFCQEARNAGYHIWCDLDLSPTIGHIGPRAWYIGDKAEPRPPVTQ